MHSGIVQQVAETLARRAIWQVDNKIVERSRSIDPRIQRHRGLFRRKRSAARSVGAPPSIQGRCIETGEY